jgi:hypothetical protein
MAAQRRIAALLLEGRIAEAEAAVEAAAPGVLAAAPAVRFRLRVQQFVELVSPLHPSNTSSAQLLLSFPWCAAARVGAGRDLA